MTERKHGTEKKKKLSMHDSNLRESQILAWSIVNEPYEKRPLDLNKKKSSIIKK